VAQIYTDVGLNLILSQMVGAPSAPSTLYTYCGLWTGSLPSEAATMASGITELSAAGYARQPALFTSGNITTAKSWSSSPTEGTAGPIAATTSSAGANGYILALGNSFSTGSFSLIKPGMYVNIVGASGGTTGTGAGTLFIVTAASGTTVTLNASASGFTNGAAVTIGDAVSGQKVTSSSALTFGPAQASWSSVGGYFIVAATTSAAASSGTTGTLVYASTFADGSTPTLAVNDTLNVTPTWLLSA